MLNKIRSRIANWNLDRGTRLEENGDLDGAKKCYK